MSNLLKRTIVAVVTIPLVLLVSFHGGIWLFLFMVVLSLLGLIEFLLNEKYPVKNYIFWVALFLWLLMLVNVYSIQNSSSLSIMTYGFAVLVGLYVLTVTFHQLLTRNTVVNIFRHSRVIAAIAYVSILYPFIFLIRENLNFVRFSFSNFDVLLFLFLIIWVGDSAALFTGKAIGKHRLSIYQPTKTIEGSIGGLAGSLLIGIIAHFWFLEEVFLVHLIILSVIAGAIGQIGDFFESYWKRSIGIKDSSKLLPGHGGILDRFDSMAFAAPVVYFYFQCIILR